MSWKLVHWKKNGCPKDFFTIPWMQSFHHPNMLIIIDIDMSIFLILSWLGIQKRKKKVRKHTLVQEKNELVQEMNLVQEKR